MVEIEFSVMGNIPSTVNKLLPLLQAFEEQNHIHVNLVAIPWDKGWAEIVKFSLFGHGPDVSEVGTTWIGSLASMQALQPITPREVQAVGGEKAFFETSWRTGFLPDDPTPWAIPWLGDVLVLYYWKDALEKAGIRDAQAAFSSHDALAETLKKLQKSGFAYPLTLTTFNISMCFHEAVLWLWSTGGDFMSADRRQVTFNQPAALEGWRKYFSLLPFVSPETLTIPSAGDLFNAGKAAVMFAGPWLGVVGRYQNPGWSERLGVASPPGAAFVGGSSFVTWKYSQHSREAFELVRFLTSQPTHIPESPHSTMLPTRREALNMPSFEHDPFHQIYLQAMQTGRAFPTVRLLGLVEEKLIQEIANIWTELFTNPKLDIDTCLHDHLDPLAERLNIALGS